MKRFLPIYLILISLNALAQKEQDKINLPAPKEKLDTYQNYKTFQLNTTMPETGKVIQFKYSGVFSDKLDPRLTLYYEKNGIVQWQSLVVTKEAGGVGGSFMLPDSIKSFTIKPRNNFRDTISELYTYNVYSNRNLASGSLASAARFFYQNNLFTGVREPEKAKALFKKEFSINPDLKKDLFLLSYFETASLTPEDPLRSEIESTWKDSIAKGGDELFLYRFYKMVSRFKDYDNNIIRYRLDLLNKYPNGMLSFSESTNALLSNIENADLEANILSLQTKFPSQLINGDFDTIYSELAIYYGKKTNFNSADQSIKEIKSKFILKDTFRLLSEYASRDDKNLSLAIIYIKQCINLANFEKQMLNQHIFDQKEWQQSVDINNGNLIDTYAQLLNRSGNVKEAITQTKLALSLDDFDSKIKAHLIQLLIIDNRYGEALEQGANYVKLNKYSEDLKAQMFIAHQNLGKSPEDFKTFYQNLLKAANLNYKLNKNQIVNFKAKNFSLQSLNGKSISLSSLKGKIVLLYFFDIKKGNPPIVDSLNNYFNRISIEYKSNKEIICYGVDVSSVDYTNEHFSQMLRKDEVRSWHLKQSFSFDVLFDKFYYNRYISNKSFFEVADSFSSNDVGQFYVIDKSGSVRYKSYPPSNDLDFDRFRREVYLSIENSKKI